MRQVMWQEGLVKKLSIKGAHGGSGRACEHTTNTVLH